MQSSIAESWGHNASFNPKRANDLKATSVIAHDEAACDNCTYKGTNGPAYVKVGISSKSGEGYRETHVHKDNLEGWLKHHLYWDVEGALGQFREIEGMYMESNRKNARIYLYFEAPYEF